MNIIIMILFLISVTLFSRILSTIGLPSVINFIHFPLILLASRIIFTKCETQLVARFLYSLGFFFIFITISAIINKAGIINVVLEFIMLIEPLLLIFCIFTIEWCSRSIYIFRNGLIFIMSIHLLMIYYQFFILGHRSDDVVGLLLNMGAGSHVSGAIALSVSVYCYFYTKQNNINIFIISNWKWFLFIMSLFVSVILSDAKQVFAAFLIAMALLSITNITDLRKTTNLIAVSFLSFSIIYLLSQTAYPALTTWAKGGLLQEGFKQKFLVFSIIHSFHNSFLNLFFGLGPGHTVGRLAMLLPDYINQLQDLGATTSEVTASVMTSHQGHFMSNSITGSSMFSLFFSWSGFWGDIGFLGTITYLYMYFIIWTEVSHDELSKFLLLTIFVFGWVFQWMEEPQYMLFIMSLIGLRWQEIKISNKESFEIMIIKKNNLSN